MLFLDSKQGLGFEKGLEFEKGLGFEKGFGFEKGLEFEKGDLKKNLSPERVLPSRIWITNSLG